MSAVEFHFDFGSPNAYLSHLVIPDIEKRTGAKFEYVPVLLGGIFKLAGNRSPAEAFAGIKNKPEYERLEMPRPAWQVLLDVAPEVAAERARHRERHQSERTRDAYERDDELQRRTGELYAQLAAGGFGGRWRVVGADVNPSELAAELASSLGQ